MKTRLFLAALLAIFANVNIMANDLTKGDSENKAQKRIVKTTMEYLVFDDDCVTPKSKTILEKDESGLLVSKFVYKWSNDGIWVPYVKYDYTYSSVDFGKPVSLLYKEWDERGTLWVEQQIKY